MTARSTRRPPTLTQAAIVSEMIVIAMYCGRCIGPRFSTARSITRRAAPKSTGSGLMTRRRISGVERRPRITTGAAASIQCEKAIPSL